MAEAVTHIIHKLVVEVETSTTERGFELKNNARTFVDDYVIPAIEEYLKELEDALQQGETVEVQQLVIGLESDTTDFSDRSWKRKLSEALERSSEEVLETVTERRASETISRNHQAQLLDNADTEQTIVPKEQEKMVKGVRLATEATRGLNAVFYFLETGLRPWWITESKAFDKLLEPENLLTMINQEQQLFWELYKRQITSQRTVKRWVGQLPDEVLEMMVSSIGNSAPDSFKRLTESSIYREYPEMTTSNIKIVRQLFWEFVIVFGPEKTFNDKQLARRFRTYLHEKIGNENRKKNKDKKGTLAVFAVTLIRWLHVLNRAEKTDAYYLALSNELSTETVTQNPVEKFTDKERHTQNQTTTSPVEDELLNREVVQGAVNSNPEDINVSDNKSGTDMESSPDSSLDEIVNEHSGETEQQSAKEDKDLTDFWERFGNNAEKKTEEGLLPEEGLVVDNAGLVLLHPFLKYFFQDVGLLDEQEQLTDPYLAAHVLHYVATGKEQDYEHAMVFEKFLVDIPFYEVLPRNIEIPETVREKVKLLFNAVRTNWEPVNGTSDEGIRETFLAREGKLIIAEDLIRLVVERKTVDILLEKLAWSLGMVHLPWKKTLIHVEW